MSERLADKVGSDGGTNGIGLATAKLLRQRGPGFCHRTAADLSVLSGRAETTDPHSEARGIVRDLLDPIAEKILCKLWVPCCPAARHRKFDGPRPESRSSWMA